MDVKIKATQVNCVVPGNIHIPTMEGIRNCEGLKGWGGGGGVGLKAKEIPEGSGIRRSIWFPDGQSNGFQNRFLPTK